MRSGPRSPSCVLGRISEEKQEQGPGSQGLDPSGTMVAPELLLSAESGTGAGVESGTGWRSLMPEQPHQELLDQQHFLLAQQQKVLLERAQQQQQQQQNLVTSPALPNPAGSPVLSAVPMVTAFSGGDLSLAEGSLPHLPPLTPPHSSGTPLHPHSFSDTAASPSLIPVSLTQSEPLISWHGFGASLPDPWSSITSSDASEGKGDVGDLPSAASCGVSPQNVAEEPEVQWHSTEVRPGKQAVGGAPEPRRGFLGKLKKSFMGKAPSLDVRAMAGETHQASGAKQLVGQAPNCATTPPGPRSPLIAMPALSPGVDLGPRPVVGHLPGLQAMPTSVSLQGAVQSHMSGPLLLPEGNPSDLSRATLQSPQGFPSFASPAFSSSSSSSGHHEPLSGPLPRTYARHMSGPRPGQLSGSFARVHAPNKIPSPPQPADAQTLIGIAPGASPAALEAYLKAKAARQRRSGNRVVKVVEVPME